jgi:release factor H-coupled RctB family protein
LEYVILEQKIQLFATKSVWLEQNALDQLQVAAALPDVVQVAGFSDLHAGKGSPIGVALATTQTIYPHVIGNDVGCGMALFTSDLEARSCKPERVMRQLDQFESFADIPLEEAGRENEDASLGTIGGGNHFAELTMVDCVQDEAIFQELALDRKQVFILVHSGSHGLGEAILRQSITAYRAQDGLAVGSVGGTWYRQEHDRALALAKINRQLIARRVLVAMGVKDSSRCLTDTVHNGLESYEFAGGSTIWVHRKGAAKADQGLVVIPGSRGSLSYLVKPVRPDEANLFSLAHGAGRKWQRSLSKGKLGNKYTVDTIQFSKLGGRVFCRDRKLLFEEAPEAYKNIDRVIADLVDFGLVKVVASYRPLLTIKY